MEAQALLLPNNIPLACSVELRDGAIVTNEDDFTDIIGLDVIGHKLYNNPTNNYGDLLGVCDFEFCHMYSGDTMSGKSAVTVPPPTDPPTDDTGADEGDNTGGDRIETAPVAVDPPILPLAYDNTTQGLPVGIGMDEEERKRRYLSMQQTQTPTQPQQKPTRAQFEQM